MWPQRYEGFGDLRWSKPLTMAKRAKDFGIGTSHESKGMGEEELFITSCVLFQADHLLAYINHHQTISNLNTSHRFHENQRLAAQRLCVVDVEHVSRDLVADNRELPRVELKVGVSSCPISYFSQYQYMIFPNFKDLVLFKQLFEHQKSGRLASVPRNWNSVSSR